MNQSQQIAARPSGLPCQIDLLAAAYPSPSRAASFVFARLVSSSWPAFCCPRLVSSSWPAFCCLQVPSRVASFVFARLVSSSWRSCYYPPYSVPCCLSRPSVNLARSALFCLISFNPNRSLDFGEIARLCQAACFWPSRRRSRLRRKQDADRGGQDARKPHFPNRKQPRRV